MGGPGPHRGFLLPYTPRVQRDDTRGAARKLQIINYLTKIRVGKATTLKMPKYLLYSDLQVAQDHTLLVVLGPAGFEVGG